MEIAALASTTYFPFFLQTILRHSNKATLHLQRKKYNNVFNLIKDKFEKPEMIEKLKCPLVKNIKKVTCISIQGNLE